MKPEGIALVTGASRGIGRALALELARRGFDVVATMRRPEDGAALPAEAERAGGRLTVEALDVTDPDSIRMPEDLRVLVNNAGVEGSHLPVEHAPVALWRTMFETNFFGLLEVTQRAIPRLRESGGGVVCNLTTASLLAPMPFFAAYRASKAAVSALGESLRTELRPFGIRVLEILPGAIGTDMYEGSNRPPEALAFEPYRPQAERVQATREPMRDAFTPASAAAAAMADAILDDDAPLRVACDPMGEGLLDGWRTHGDESSMQGMLDLFAPRTGEA
jgi:NAD(P)-dependent dehydrogenase (short-subunit alcohol dehydrogenase family)